jgi:hypothetical protein
MNEKSPKQFLEKNEKEKFVQHIKENYGGHSALYKLVEGLSKFEVKNAA